MSRATLVAAFLAISHCSICVADERQSPIVLLSMLECCPEEVWPEAEKAVRDEFEAISLPVLIVQNAESASRTSSDEFRLQAEKYGAVCVIRIVRLPGSSEGHVEVWTRALSGRVPVVQLLKAGGNPDSEEAQILALRTVEIFHTSNSQVKLKKSEETNSLVPKESRDVEKKTDTRPKDIQYTSVSLGIGVMFSPGEIGLMGSLNIAVRWKPLDDWTLEFDGVYSLIGQDLEFDNAGATFDLATTRAWIIYEPQSGRILRPCLGAGAGFAVAWSEGDASGDYVSRLDSIITGYLGITGQVVSSMMKNLQMRISIRYGLVLPEIALRFGGNEVARFGSPLIEGNISFEYQF